MYEAFLHAHRACFCTACNVIPEDDVTPRPSTVTPLASHLPPTHTRSPLAPVTQVQSGEWQVDMKAEQVILTLDHRCGGVHSTSDAETPHLRGYLHCGQWAVDSLLNQMVISDFARF